MLSARARANSQPRDAKGRFVKKRGGRKSRTPLTLEEMVPIPPTGYKSKPKKRYF